MPKGVYERGENHRRAIVQGIENAGGRADDRNANWRGGKTKHPLYLIYNDIKRRCSKPGHPRYSDYGGRGISVCSEWVEDFWAFVRDVGDRPEGVNPGGRAKYSLDRIDNEGNYEPGNVRWATSSEQILNSRPRTPQPFCRNGHEMTPENTANYASGQRRCRACARNNEYNRTRSRIRRGELG